MKEKHTPRTASQEIQPLPDDFEATEWSLSDNDIMNALKTIPSASSAGLFGFTKETLMHLIQNDDSKRIIKSLTKTTLSFLKGNSTSQLEAMMALAYGVPLYKNEMLQIRGISINDTIGKIMSKCVLKTFPHHELIQYGQFGVGFKNGIDIIMHNIYNLSCSNACDDYVKVITDLSNAYGEINQTTMMEQVDALWPSASVFMRQKLQNQQQISIIIAITTMTTTTVTEPTGRPSKDRYHKINSK